MNLKEFKQIKEIANYLKFDNVATQEFKEEYVLSMFELIQKV